MKSLEYNLLEDFMDSILPDEYEKEIELTQKILELGMELDSVDNIFNNTSLYSGDHLAMSGRCLYSKSNVAINIPSILPEVDNKQLTLYKILSKSNLNNGIKVTPMSDREILYSVYKAQWEEIYGILLRLIDYGTDIEEVNTEEISFLLKDREDIKWYKKLYKKTKLGIKNTIVKTIYEGRKINHIYVSMDLHTGVPYLNINKNKSEDGTDGRFESYRRVFIPLGVLPKLEKITKTLEITITDEDLIECSNIGKISGFMVGSKPDLEIFNFLRIDNLYNENFSHIYEDNTEEEYCLDKSLDLKPVGQKTVEELEGKTLDMDALLDSITSDATIEY